MALLVGLRLSSSMLMAQQSEETVTFEIRGFETKGATLYPEETLRRVLKEYAGKEKTAADVEKARESLEKLYHGSGYPAVLVNIPEQTVDDGIVRLEVIETTIGRVRVTGNRYFSREKILKKVPSLQPGEKIYVPDVQDDMNRLNRNPDLKVTPVLTPGRELGTIDVDLQVKDELPLHGSLEVNNRNTHDTTNLRVNTTLRYDNLWQKEHSVSLQYQTSPENRDEVLAVAGSYVLPSPWNENHVLAIYGIWSDSDTAFGQGFEVLGSGYIFGLRYVMPLPDRRDYTHNITLGLDYKDFDETLGFQGGGDETKTPITYLPLLISYTGALPDSTGRTQLSAGLNMAFRGLVTTQEEFETKRFKAKGNYIYTTLGLERSQKLPAGFSLFAKLDGQIADQPLISNEQYSAGGMKSVRGYKESESLGDDAIHASLELIGPDLGRMLNVWDKLQLFPYVFYDAAALWIKDPLPGQDKKTRLQGTGLGIRGMITKYVEYEVAWGIALEDTDQVDKGDSEVYFTVKGQF